MTPKLFLLAVAIVAMVFAFGVPVSANAEINNAADCIILPTEAEQISCLQVIIAQIMAQIQEILAGQNTGQDWCHTFNNNLGYANSGSSEVGHLHTALTKQGFSYSPDTGNTYSDGTASAVSQFQEKYAPDILAPWGLTKGTGYVGSTTRAKLNQLYGCTTICNPNWQCTSWSTCLNGSQTRNCTDYNSCGTSTGKPIETQSCNATCFPNWQCTSWSTCLNGSQTRNCTDYNSCGTSSGKPVETKSCTSTCSPDWDCTPWSTCLNNTKTRTCSDINTCGVNTGKPAVAKLCSETCTPYWTCTPWSTCLNNTKTRTCSDINFCGVTTGKPAETESCSTVCTENWQCSDWSACVNGTQTKTCTDYNYCGTTDGKPAESQSCVVPCTDSDEGLSYYTKGTAIGRNNWDGAEGSYVDSCFGSTLSEDTLTLTEYNCVSNAVARSNYTCSYGCLKGACRAQPLYVIGIAWPYYKAEWQIGTNHQISWVDYSSDRYSGLYDIYLASGYPYTDSSPYPDPIKYVINDNVYAQYPVSYKYNWDVWTLKNPPGVVVLPGTHIIQVCRADTSICGSSDAFNILSGLPSITLAYPNGGEEFIRGAFASIGWNSSRAKYVTIYLQKETGERVGIASDVPASQGGYIWQVPVTVPTGNDYKIKVETTDASYQNTAIDESNSFLSIITSITCSETDSGQDYYTGGTTTGQAEEGNYYHDYKDYCSGNILTEYYCSDTGSVKYVEYVCPDGSAVDDCWGTIPSYCRQ